MRVLTTTNISQESFLVVAPAAAASQLTEVDETLGWSLHSVGGRAVAASEARESHGDPGGCPLQLLAFLPFPWVQVPRSRLCPCIGCAEIRVDGKTLCFCNGEGGPADQQE